MKKNKRDDHLKAIGVSKALDNKINKTVNELIELLAKVQPIKKKNKAEARTYEISFTYFVEGKKNLFTEKSARCVSKNELDLVD